ncbi:uncharacterized protein LOC144738830 isoform X2 [Lampetra planeri]
MMSDGGAMEDCENHRRGAMREDYGRARYPSDTDASVIATGQWMVCDGDVVENHENHGNEAIPEDFGGDGYPSDVYTIINNMERNLMEKVTLHKQISLQCIQNLVLTHHRCLRNVLHGRPLSPDMNQQEDPYAMQCDNLTPDSDLDLPNQHCCDYLHSSAVPAAPQAPADDGGGGGGYDDGGCGGCGGGEELEEQLNERLQSALTSAVRAAMALFRFVERAV